MGPVSLLREQTALAECPTWRPDEQALYFTDIPAGKIWRFDAASGRARIFHEGEITGGLTLQRDGHWLLFRQEDVALLDAEGRLEKSWPIDLPGAQRCNDVVADPQGRVFTGTIGSQPGSGGLFRFNLDGTCDCLFQDTRIANGMTFSPDGASFYWTCSTSATIHRFDYCAETGEISNRTFFHQSTPEDGTPDGLTVDVEGNLWSARWGGSRVVVLSPRGEKIRQIDFPDSNISSLTWGGRNWTDLYVTCARDGGEPGLHDLFVVPEAGQGRPDFRSNLPSLVKASKARSR